MAYLTGRPSRRQRRAAFVETMEARVLLAGDLVGHWIADDLNAELDDQATVSRWADSVSGIEGSAIGQPILAKGQIGGRSAIRFETSDGVDAIKVAGSVSPLRTAEDFSVFATFQTDSSELQGGRDVWFSNSGLVDANSRNFGRDWGLSINPEGAISAGIGTSFGASANVYSDVSGLNDGQMHVATLTRSGDTLTLYVDGNVAGSTADGVAGPLSPIDTMFGNTSSSGDVGFDGDIAEIRMYNGALTSTEVSNVIAEVNSYYANAKPQATPDAYTVAEDSDFFLNFFPADQGVLANDTDADGDPLTATVIETTQHGTLTFQADGSFFYLPDSNFFGTDTFTYVAEDFRASEPTTVTMNVSPVYDPALPVSDRYKMLSGTLLTVGTETGLLANDLNIDEADLKVVLERTVSRGSLSLLDDGSFDYDPQGAFGIETFAYRIDDGTNISNSVEVTILINSPPIANDDQFMISEDVALNTGIDAGVTQNDIDAESDPFTVTLLSEPEFGTLSLSENGAVSYTPNANYYGDDSFTYQLSDGEDLSNVATATITVQAVNDAPSPEKDVYFGLSGQTIEIAAGSGVLANDIDVEGGTLTATLVSGPTQGSVEFNSDGSFAYQAPAGFTGLATFTYSVSDGQTNSQPTEVEIAINSLVQQQQILINEIHIDPPVKTEIVEFVELYNQGDVPVDVSDWTIRDGIGFRFPAGSSVEPGGYLVVAMDPQMFQSKFKKPAIGPWEGKLNNSGETIELWSAGGDRIDRVDYNVGFPWPSVGEEPGPSIQLIHPALENDIGGSWRSAAPTPGAKNSVFAENAAPQMRQINHSPEQPTAEDAVTITTYVTDPSGIQNVTLEYQLVDPGNYFSLSDARYKTSWTSVAMLDDGQNGDATAADNIYTAVLPAELQTHRRLVRYRITSTDTAGASITAPYADDLQPNFAYFVYNGIPDWTAADRPGRTPDVTYDSELLNSVPVYQLITTKDSHLDSQYIPDSSRRGGYSGSDYLWEGTLVYDGAVYDHIRFRARGGVWRYAMGKNMWKFDFNRGHRFQARDDYGSKYDTKWDKLNFSSVVQQGDFQHRGEQGLFESVGFKLFNLAGTESPNTNYVHFRIIESANEQGADQYSTDFQGMYLAIEQPDGQFLDEHDLPDGNFYKIEGNNPESTTNQGPYQVDDRSDGKSFIREFRGGKRPTVEWWKDNLNLEKYYTYQTISHAIHHYDTAFGKNFFYYNNPETGLWEIHPWDLDLTWADNMYGNENHEFNVKVAKNNDFNDYTLQANIDLKNRLNRDYQNSAREILDLLFNQEQTGMLIDEMASFVYQPGEQSFVDADRAMWDYNPVNAQNSKYSNSSKNASRWKYYQKASSKDYPGMIKILKDYVDKRNKFITDRILTNEENIPTTPTISYAGEAGFPVSDLTFQTSTFASPVNAEFAAMEWRISEITDPSVPGFDRYNRTAPRKYEIESTWESGELDAFADTISIPSQHVEAGKQYRVRVRMMDNDQHWSHWSDPAQFVTSADVAPELANSLRISEINYNPYAATAAEKAAGHTSNEDFEFIELINIGDQSIDLTPASLEQIETDTGDQGVNFTFAEGNVTSLAPGERVLVVEDVNAFKSRYGSDLPIAGSWGGRLSNDSEQITLSAFGTTIQQFSYQDEWYPSTDGDGYTLEIVDANQSDLNQWSANTGWKASSVQGGTPGKGADERLPGDVNGDGLFNSSDLVAVFQLGQYEDGIAGNSGFGQGDWNGDGEFDSTDFVYVFQLGVYSAGASPVSSLENQDLAAALQGNRESSRGENSTGELRAPTLTTNRRPVAIDSVSALDQIFDDLDFERESVKTTDLLTDDEDFGLVF